VSLTYNFVLYVVTFIRIGFGVFEIYCKTKGGGFNEHIVETRLLIFDDTAFLQYHQISK